MTDDPGQQAPEEQADAEHLGELEEAAQADRNDILERAESGATRPSDAEGTDELEDQTGHA